MSSDHTAPRPGSAQRRTRRWLRERSPWFAWLAAVIAVIWLGRGVAASGTAPAMAELKQVALSSPRAARVVEVKVAPGDQVVADQPLVQLDTTEVDAELAVARAELEKLRLEIAAQGIALKDGALETNERLASDAESAALVVAQLEATEQRDRSELAQLDEQIARQQRLVDEKLAAANTLNELKLRRAALAREVEEYGRTLRQARSRAQSAAQRLAEWRGGKRSAKSAPAAPDSSLEQQLAPYRAAVAAQQERVLQIERLRAGLTLTAPYAGLVGEVLLSAGDTAAAGATVVTVVDDHPRVVIAYVDQMWGGRVKVGDTATLRPSDGSGPRRSGRVFAVAASISELPIRFRLVPTHPTYCRAVYIALDEGHPAPLPGQAFDASFRRGKPATASSAEPRPGSGS
ncbi:MAG: HlyD family efflux transporter periplasmic adaptor subunit [Deltaproteobacteria bacterium]|nr:HlyD family efflux transporter periplasmic adaptor subunit [Deltaproteobacteria bacterium]